MRSSASAISRAPVGDPAQRWRACLARDAAGPGDQRLELVAVLERHQLHARAQVVDAVHQPAHRLAVIQPRARALEPDERAQHLDPAVAERRVAAVKPDRLDPRRRLDGTALHWTHDGVPCSEIP
jgi:hypothetical protein